MSDTPEDDKPVEKKLTGFADPKLKKNINRGGRPRGAKGKVPTDAAIKESFKSSSSEAIEKLKSLMRNGNEANQLKSAIKIIDVTMSILVEDEKVKVSKKDSKTGESSEYEVEKRKDGSGGQVVSFLRTEYVAPEED